MTHAAVANAAGALVEDYIDLLSKQTGVPVEVILIGAHAHIVAMLVERIGGELVAASCERAASRVRDLPSRGACELTYAVPAGSA